MTAWYNETDPAAAAVLRGLIAEGVIAPGCVDTRSIADVRPDEIAGYAQVHLFAGGGLWSVAARLAGWPDDRPLWTGSCPCQPFSCAGARGGRDDPRHLWPHFHRLVRARRPAVVMGEQVARKAGRDWFDGVAADLEGDGYACRAVDIPACAVDAPHIRSRLYWIAGRHDMVDASRLGRREGRPEHGVVGGRGARPGADAQGVALGDTDGPRRALGREHLLLGQCAPAERTDGGELADADGSERRAAAEAGHDPDRAQGGRVEGADRAGERPESHWAGGALGLAECGGPEGRDSARGGSGAAHASGDGHGSFWAGADWIACHDSKKRRAQPGLRLLVDGFPGRVDLWRIAGNAIVPVVAAEVVRAFMETCP